ncbi:hypothetical protein A2U01_0096550, partial [Trifolium medium]|nr:hypothetical protein [Trifolium medium]
MVMRCTPCVRCVVAVYFLASAPRA